MTQPNMPLPYASRFLTPEERKWQRRRKFRRLIFIVAFCVFLLCAGFFILNQLALDAGLVEYPFQEKLASQAVAQIVNGRLKPAPGGIVTLPPNLAPASMGGKAYVTIDSAGVTWVVFQTWRGKGCNMRGYAFHSNPASAPPPATVTLWGPDIFASQEMPYTVDSQEGASWYRIYWDMD